MTLRVIIYNWNPMVQIDVSTSRSRCKTTHAKKLYSSCIKNEQILWHWLVTREIDNDWLTSRVIVAWQSGIGRNTHPHYWWTTINNNERLKNWMTSRYGKSNCYYFTDEMFIKIIKKRLDSTRLNIKDTNEKYSWYIDRFMTFYMTSRNGNLSTICRLKPMDIM